MRKIVSTFLLCALFASLVQFSSGAHADSQALVVDPVSLMNSQRPTTSARGIIFEENVQLGASIGWIRTSQDGYVSCDSWETSPCQSVGGREIDGNVQLGYCKTATELGCVEALWISNAEGQLTKLQFVKPAFANVQDIPESQSLGIPRSSSPAIFRDDAGHLYLIRAGLWVLLPVHRLPTQPPVFRLSVDVNPISEVPMDNLQAPTVQRLFDASLKAYKITVVPSPSECLATDVGICYKQLVWSLDSQIRVQIRVPKSVSGWIRGRMTNQLITVSPETTESNLLDVQSAPANVLVAGGWVKYSALPPNFIKSLWPNGGYDQNPNSVYFLISDPSQDSEGVKAFNAWIPYLNNQDMEEIPSWSFGSNFVGQNSCLKGGGSSLTGFVSSNASAYSSEPPVWDQQNEDLSYQVAAPHLDSHGNPSTGSYTLSLSDATLKCLYGRKSLPSSATVEVLDADGVTSVATTVINNDGKWLNFTANGFHYSNPTIKIHFADNAPSTNATATPAPSIAKPKAISFKCSKNGTVKRFSGSKVACPTGYKLSK